MATFTNKATLTYNGLQINSNTVSGEVIGGLTVTKRAVVSTYSSGSTVTYTIGIVNAGPQAYTGLILTDDLGEYQFGTGTLVPTTHIVDAVIHYVNGVPQAAPTVTSEEPLTITGINIPAGGNAVIVYSVTVNGFAPLEGDGATITNTATLSGGGLTNPIEAENTIFAETDAILTITKSISPRNVPENGTVTYTFLIENTNATEVTADADAFVSDLFDPVLSNLTATLNGAPLTLTTQYTYDVVSGQFTTVPGVITVPAAFFTQDATTGEWTVTPGMSTLTVTGTV